MEIPASGTRCLGRLGVDVETAAKIVICSARGSADRGPLGAPRSIRRPEAKRRDPMIRRIRRSVPWFGAVAAISLLALPVQADDIEPEPYVEEEVVEPEPEPVVEAEVKEAEPKVAEESDRNIEKFFDLVLFRPLGLVQLVVGGAFFVPAALLASPSGVDGIQAAWEHFVVPSVENTFQRPLGLF
jgi:hypothetical protein